MVPYIQIYLVQFVAERGYRYLWKIEIVSRYFLFISAHYIGIFNTKSEVQIPIPTSLELERLELELIQPRLASIQCRALNWAWSLGLVRIRG